MDMQKLEQFVLEALETETGGLAVYAKALECAENPQLRAEWHKYYEQTERHREILLEACAKLGIDPSRRSAGCDIVRATAESLVRNMDMAIQAGDPGFAQIVAAEAVLQAEHKDHLNWQLIGLVTKEATGRTAEVLKNAHDMVEDQEDEHVFHSMGWARELLAESLGIKSVLPPPEEKMDAKTVVGAATSQQARRLM